MGKKYFVLFFLSLISGGLQAQVAESDTIINISVDTTVAIDMSAQTTEKTPTTGIVLPEFPGGDAAKQDFLSATLVYPKKAYKKGASGIVSVSFTVEIDGSLTSIHIHKTSGNKYLDAEALRVVKLMPKWIPAFKHGQIVRVAYHLPIRFALNR